MVCTAASITQQETDAEAHPETDPETDDRKAVRAIGPHTHAAQRKAWTDEATPTEVKAEVKAGTDRIITITTDLAKIIEHQTGIGV